MNLYRELLDCLKEESQALVSAREEAILTAAGKKEELLDRLLRIKQERERGTQVADAGLPGEQLASLQRQVVSANARNREIAAASLELIQEFLALLLPPDPGLYRPAGQAKPLQEGIFFQRRA
ncbi:MAG: flagellar export chaperone FlgN [Deltaproteobacteria bacterium]|nr:flagellar export chaperone FlgN [Deltaproteobacteria bacterium]